MFQFYSVPVRASDRGRVTESELVEQFLKIMEIPADAKTLPIGILTTAKRPIWAKAREELLKSMYRVTHSFRIIHSTSVSTKMTN